MQDFKIFSIGDCAEIISGGTPKTSVAEYWNGNISWISIKDFSNEGKYIFETEKKITAEGLKKSSTNLLQRDDLIISARGTVGELAMIFSPMAFNQSCYGLRAKKNIIDADFLYYAVKNKINAIKKITHGTVFDTITKNTFYEIKIEVPPLEVQKKIAAVLSSLDDKIELNNKINQNLEQQAQAIFKNMFPKIIDGNFSVGNYISPKRGKSLVSKNAVFGNFPVVAGGLEPATYHNQFNTKSPVITISASGNAGYVRLWNIPVWSSDSSFIDSTVTENVYFWYVMLKLRQEEIYSLRIGTVQQHIYPKHIENLSIKKLDEEKIKNFNSEVEPFFLMIGKNQQENKSLAEMRDLLLPRLLNGEIDASKVEI